MKVLITGSCGLVGSEAVRYFQSLALEIVGIDNDKRQYFFGQAASTDIQKKRLLRDCKNYVHHNSDINDQETVEKIVSDLKPDLVIHSAAQPSHDWAATDPMVDFDVNARGTLILLEAVRKHCPQSVFAFLSTNKVYGDGPNHLPLEELDTRYELKGEFASGIGEDFPVDRVLHSLFGVSKLSADLMVQEYGRYFNMNTVCFRCGCITGNAHAGVEQHGFLSHLVKVAKLGGLYTIFGYKGKQVRDQIHGHDVVSAIHTFYKHPAPASVFNLGGGKENSISILEVFEKLKKQYGLAPEVRYVDKARVGDHICYYSNNSRFKEHYPEWSPKFSLDQILDEMMGSK